MISACVNCRDDEATIVRWLDCVAPHVNEIIICDTGSLDSTKDLARNYRSSVKLTEIPWTNFLDARNRFFEIATQPFIIQFDIDEVLPNSFWAELPKYVQAMETGYDSIRLNHYNDKSVFTTLDDLNERVKSPRHNLTPFSYPRDVLYRTDLPKKNIKFEVMKNTRSDVFNNLSPSTKFMLSDHPLIHSYPSNHKIRNSEYHARKFFAYAKITPGYWERSWSRFLAQHFTKTQIDQMKTDTNADPADRAPHATWWGKVGRLQAPT